ncbi:Metallo-dependent phosphatase-like protein [Amanita rubescens]|nr:Metallo-dependent phosphatase-like protein [Amanita rubescens]
MLLPLRVRLLVILLCISCISGHFVDEFIDGFEDAIDCVGCHALLVPAQFLAYFGDSVFSRVWIAICQITGIADADVCQGAVSREGAILAHDLRSISVAGQTATKLCDVVFGLCRPPPVNQFTILFPKPSPQDPKVFTSLGRTPFKVSHFSDVHIDRSYAPGSDAKCTKPICCRDYGHPGPVVQPAGPFGSYHCDAPPTLSDSMLNAISNTTQFSIFTGDVINGRSYSCGASGVTRDLEAFNDELTSLGTPVYPVIVVPVNAFPRSTTQSANTQWVFDTQGQGWSRWLDPEATQQVIHHSGSYSAVPEGTKLRIISLNNIYWYKDKQVSLFFYLYDSDELQPDPNSILAFLVQELQAAEDAGQRAWIMAHMPPGRTDVLRDQSNYFNQIVLRYSNTVAGQFYGHTHMDQFAVGYTDSTKHTAESAFSFCSIAPSLTPRNGNPAFKIYDVDPDTYEIMDSRVYMSNVTDPTFQQNPSWDLYYSARDTYGPLVGLAENEPLGPAFWHKVTEVFEANDTAFELYRTFTTRGVGLRPCDAVCKSKVICDLRTMRSEDSCVSLYLVSC